LPSLGEAIERSHAYLVSLQKDDGHWVGELQGDTILESEYVLLLAFLGRESDERVGRLANYLLQQQLPDGGWSIYPGGPPEISASVKAYFALKVAGHDPDSRPMRLAREVILSLGGADHCNSFTNFYLALLGQVPYACCPAVPPELLLLPRWAYVNLYAMSSWTRTIVVPLSLMSAYKPVRHLAATMGIRELFLQPPEERRWPQPLTRWPLSWSNLFLFADRLFKSIESWGLGRLRRRALAAAEKWLLNHFADSDGVGAIFPPMIYTVVALRCLGYGDDTSEMHYALEQLDRLMIEEGDTLRLQPCFSPVWDSALSLLAVADARKVSRSAGDGVMAASREAITKGVDWLLQREVRRPGDWSIANPDVAPGGWFFEYRNGFYPDTDDTAMVLMALARTSSRSDIVATAKRNAACRRGLDWLLAMQNSDGGWAAFDRDINRELLTKIPFADHNAMLDPSCPDITARVLEGLGHFGYSVEHPRVARALRFLERTQEPAGGWPGRWGVNYIYGTWQVLQGLSRIGYDMTQPRVQHAVRWLKSTQQAQGGWGETCRSYDDPALAGQGTPTASQTAWAILGLVAAGHASSPEVQAGLEYLVRTQRADGGWDENEFTGTGFPKVFYLKYHLYALYFPLMAMARAAANNSIVPTRRLEQRN
jgi:squalene-hopene/tetraprenyl-beta-curcumene cyclase